MCQAAIISTSNASCKSGEVTCDNGLQPTCLEPGFIPACINDSPSCCPEGPLSTQCSSTGPSCNASSTINPHTTLDIEIVAGPELPSIIETPNSENNINNISRFAYPGSNPSFEIKLKTATVNTSIISVDLIDSNNIKFRNAGYSTLKVDGISSNLILVLSLPKDIAIGGTTFNLNLDNGTSLSGLIEVIQSANIENNDASDLIISMLSATRRNKAIDININGKGYIEKNTSITLLPSNLQASVKKLAVSKNGKHLSGRISFVKNLKENTDLVLVIATPKGIVSKMFTLK